MRPSPVLEKSGSAIKERGTFIKEKAVGCLVAMLKPDVLHPSWSPGAGLPVGCVAAWRHSWWVSSLVPGAFASSACTVEHLGVIQHVLCLSTQFLSLRGHARVDSGPKNLNGLET